MKARIIDDSGEAIVIYTERECPANPGRAMTYMHVGQHGEASLDFIRKNCHKAVTDDGRAACAELLAEIKRQ